MRSVSTGSRRLADSMLRDRIGGGVVDALAERCARMQQRFGAPRVVFEPAQSEVAVADLWYTSSRVRGDAPGGVRRPVVCRRVGTVVRRAIEFQPDAIRNGTVELICGFCSLEHVAVVLAACGENRVHAGDTIGKASRKVKWTLGDTSVQLRFQEQGGAPENSWVLAARAVG